MLAGQIVGLHDLLYRPGWFFAQFAGDRPGRAVALLPFLVIALFRGYGMLPAVQRHQYGFFILGIVIGAILNVVVLALVWVHLGARAMGGRAPFDFTLRGVGYALFWPTLLAFAVRLLLDDVPGYATGQVISILALLVTSVAWGTGLTAVAVHRIHGLSWLRTIVVILWLPCVAVLVGLLLFLARSQ